jgi:hypothetical protein
MNKLMDTSVLVKPLCLLLLIAPRLTAQAAHTDSDQKITDDVRSATAYCDAVDEYAKQQRPQLFAKLRADSTEKPKNGEWKEFAGKLQWEAAGKPRPLAFVWSRGGVIVLVSVVYPPPVRISYVVNRRTEYCYGGDAQLSRIRAVGYMPTHCEFLFPCELIRENAFHLGQAPGMTDWIFTADGYIQELRDGKVQNDPLDPACSLRVADLHLGSSKDLPFVTPTPE